MDEILSYQIDEPPADYINVDYIDKYKPYMYYLLPMMFFLTLLLAFYKLTRALRPKRHKST